MKQVAPLNKLLVARNRLRDLLTKLDGNDRLDQLLFEIVANTEGLEQLKAAQADNDSQIALEAPAADAPDAEPQA